MFKRESKIMLSNKTGNGLKRFPVKVICQVEHYGKNRRIILSGWSGFDWELTD